MEAPVHDKVLFRSEDWQKIELDAVDVGCSLEFEKIRSAYKFIFNIKLDIQVIIFNVIGTPEIT